MPSSKPKHKEAHEAVNTPPSRNPELMRRMYTLMVRCREAHPETMGLEATVAGSLMGLLPEDSLTIAHGGKVVATLFAKKKTPEVLDLAPLDAKSATVGVDAHISLAAGYALERSLRHKPGLVLAFAGVADSLAGARATLTFAATHRLPLIVVVQHELSRLKPSQSPIDLSHEILGVGMPGMTVDGSDAMAVYRVTQEAMYRARHEGGPTLIECKTYRKRKVPARLRMWVQGDAIEYMEEQLRARNYWQDDLTN